VSRRVARRLCLIDRKGWLRMQVAPGRLLEDVRWSFSEPVPHAVAELIDMAGAYATEIDAADPKANLRQSLPFRDVCLKYEYAVQAPGGEWQEAQAELRVVGAQLARLTGADLLWELHVACASTVGESDRHFFEGLELEDAGTGLGRPLTYRVLLGS
jgi:hypothetical protein